MKNESAARSAHLATTTQTSRKPLPKYLFLRSGIYYFKRKVPQGVSHAFPQAMGGQVWKSLGTDLLERARPPLAAEVTEFELTLAIARCELALSHVEGVDSGCAIAAGKPSSPKRRNHDAKAASAKAERVTSVNRRGRPST
jgi:hypothetical protein